MPKVSRRYHLLPAYIPTINESWCYTTRLACRRWGAKAFGCTHI